VNVCGSGGVFSASGPKGGGSVGGGGGVARASGAVSEGRGNVNCHGNDGRPHKADE